MIYALIAVSLLFVLAAGYGLGQDEQNEILEAKNREQTATIDSQAAVIRDLKDDEANLLVQLQSANRKLVEKDKLIAEKDKQIEKVQKRQIRIGAVSPSSRNSIKRSKLRTSTSNREYQASNRPLSRWPMRSGTARSSSSCMISPGRPISKNSGSLRSRSESWRS